MTGQAACENVEIRSDKKKRVILEHAQLDDVRGSGASPPSRVFGSNFLSILVGECMAFLASGSEHTMNDCLDGNSPCLIASDLLEPGLLRFL